MGFPGLIQNSRVNNIHKSEALKSEERTNKQQLLIIRPDEIVHKFVAKDHYFKNHIKKNCQKSKKNQHVLNRRTDFLVKIIDLIQFLNRT